MSAAPIPDCEAERLQALYDFAILDTPIEPNFERVTSLATRVCGVPIALVSFVDAQRQWIKAHCGLEVKETSRDVAFCAYTILTSEVLVVEDTHQDPRFTDNPLVTGAPGIRFYAGAPLQTAEGQNLGALCLIDLQPRAFSEEQRQILKDLAAMVVRELEFRRTTRHLQEQSELHMKLIEETEQIVNSVSSILIGVDERNVITHWNQTAERVLGISSETVLGQPFERCELRWNKNDILDSIQTCKHTNQAIRMSDMPFFNVEGDMRLLGISINPICMSDGIYRGAILLAADITERKHTEEMRAELMAELEERNWELVEARNVAIEAACLKSEFLANTSHELRTPLNGVIGMIDLLLNTTLDDNQQLYAQTVKRSAVGLMTIINDILDFSKIEAKKMTIESTAFSLYDLMEEATMLLAPKAFEKNLEFSCELPPLPLSGIEASERLEGDPVRIRQIMLNLLSNAIKFTPSGEVILGAELLAESATEARWYLFVRDTGIGVPQEKQALIFESFAQADGSTTRKYGGTGLGLTISRQLAFLMGGEIGMSSEVGKGSIFWLKVTLKKQGGLTDISNELLESPAGPGSEDNAGPVTECLHSNLVYFPKEPYVLVVEPNTTQRRSLCRLLSAWRYAAVESSDAAQALAALKERTAAGQQCLAALMARKPSSSSDEEVARQLHLALKAAGAQAAFLVPIGFSLPKEEWEGAEVALLHKPIRQRELLEYLKPPSSADTVMLQEQSASAFHSDGLDVSARILLVEDDTINQIVAQHLLKSFGFAQDRVTIADNGRLALDALATAEFDIVLMDVQMPEMDGVEATQVIRENERKAQTKPIPIVAMTAHAMSEDREYLLGNGMDDYVSKPIDRVQLQTTLTRWLPAPDNASASDPASVNGTEPSQLEMALQAARTTGRWNQARLTGITGGDAQLEQRLLCEYLTTTAKSVMRCSLALEMEDCAALHHWAHTLKGSSRTLGLERLGGLCQELETCGQNQSLHAAEDVYQALKEEWLEVEALLQEWLARQQTVM